LFIRIHANNEENNVIVKKQNEIDISMIHNVLSERKAKLDESNIDVYYDFWIFIVMNQIS